MDFLYKTPFFRPFVALVIGIISFNYLQANIMLPLSVAAISILILIVSFLFNDAVKSYRYRWVFGLGIILLFISIGFLISYKSEKESEFNALNKTTSFIVVLTSPTVEKPKSYRAEVSLKYQLTDNKWQKARGRAIVYFEKTEKVKDLLTGDKILCRTSFKAPPGTENPSGFNYADYLKKNGIQASSFIRQTDWKLIESPVEFSVVREANILRTILVDIFKSHKIAGQEFAVLSALTLGYTDDLSPETKASYSASGAMHILSVSGLHVGIVYVVIAFLLSFLKNGPVQIWSKTVFIIVFLWSYAFITGLSPSVVRSALMFSFVAVGAALNRKSQIYNTVFMSAFIMLIYHPNYLYDIGFQLSYAAVLSIVLFQKPIAGLMPTNHKIIKWLRNLLAVSLAAQIGTLPFTFYYFQQFPNYFILTNLVAIPLSTFVIYGAMLLLAVSWLPAISQYVAIGLQSLLTLLNTSINAIFNLPNSVTEIPLNFIQSALLLVVISQLFFFYINRKATFFISALVTFLVLIIPSVLNIYNTKRSEQILVYSDNKHLHVNILTGTNNRVYTTDSTQIRRVADKYWKNNFIGKPIFSKFDFRKTDVLFGAGKRIVISNENHWKYKTQCKRLKTDILIIGNKQKPHINNLLENIEPGLIIVDKTISSWYCSKIRKSCLLHRIPFYSVSESGAYHYKNVK